MSTSTKWFLIILGCLLLFGFGVMILFYSSLRGISGGEEEIITGHGDKLAVIELNGVIMSSSEIVRQFKKYRDDRSIKGILFRVDSPGGGVVASQEMYEEVKSTREKGKPVVVSMGSMAASGGYYVSSPANRIVANAGTLTGSIGVISQFMEYDSLLGKLGVGVNTIKSGKFKDAGNPFRKMSGADKEYFQSLMDDVHQQFISAVEQQRKINHDSLVAFSDGRVFTGRQAVKMGLVDTIGTYEDAIKILAGIVKIEGEPSIVKERKRGLTLFDYLMDGKVGELFGLKERLLEQPILQYRMIHGF